MARQICRKLAKFQSCGDGARTGTKKKSNGSFKFRSRDPTGKNLDVLCAERCFSEVFVSICVCLYVCVCVCVCVCVLSVFFSG